ncbi:MAG: 30S ribosomal protein S2 [Candidatus Paceibacterota bacterium]|jgi:small subunit ribosomal protein S2
MDIPNDQKDQKQVSGAFLDADTLFSGVGADEETLLEMAQAGVLYGHKKSRKNPHFDEYIFSTRNGIEVIDLTKTLKAIDIVSGFLKKAIEDKKTFVIVGTQPAATDSVMALAQALGDCSYVTRRWIGGLFTNFSILSKRINYYKQQKDDLTQGRLDKYTKKEQLLIKREVEKMEHKFTGVENMGQVPDIMFVIDGSPKGHKTAIAEARIKHVPVLGIIDSDDDPNDFAYFVPANDHARSSIDWVINRIIANLK